MVRGRVPPTQEETQMIDEESCNRLQGKQREMWLDLLYEISADPTIVGASRHLLYIGRKQVPRERDHATQEAR
jgi:hypothetical protein